MTYVALIDDHAIFSDALASLINDFEGFEIIWVAREGSSAITLLSGDGQQPDIVLLDIIMPGLNGIDVAKWIFQNRKEIKVIALTMEEDDNSVIEMLQFGVRGYLLKNIDSEELLIALQHVKKFGFYYTPIITSNIQKQLVRKVQNPDVPELSGRERELLQLLCTDMTYAEISTKIFLSESTVDTYRARLFEKFEVRNRIGLILKAVSLGMVKL